MIARLKPVLCLLIANVSQIVLAFPTGQPPTCC